MSQRSKLYKINKIKNKRLIFTHRSQKSKVNVNLSIKKLFQDSPVAKTRWNVIRTKRAAKRRTPVNGGAVIVLPVIKRVEIENLYQTPFLLSLAPQDANHRRTQSHTINTTLLSLLSFMVVLIHTSKLFT